MDAGPEEKEQKRKQQSSICEERKRYFFVTIRSIGGLIACGAMRCNTISRATFGFNVNPADLLGSWTHLMPGQQVDRIQAKRHGGGGGGGGGIAMYELSGVLEALVVTRTLRTHTYSIL